ncbi:hypothetical protein ETAA1_60390 [Urbifossiella limnaea]|uniref:Helix-turn-helix domain-containing protein n=1 Tax=Urbifossiella limnaea TaxID=2528023 RepID=A0A517Y2V1_9BACT|nr:hypothetical protein ETAA1_60390 [Urbifossiella limnaea]
MVSFTAEDVGTPSTAYQDRIDRAHELRAAGWKLQDIADEMGVCFASVHVYLRESPRGSASTL